MKQLSKAEVDALIEFCEATINKMPALIQEAQQAGHSGDYQKGFSSGVKIVLNRIVEVTQPDAVTEASDVQND